MESTGHLGSSHASPETSMRGRSSAAAGLSVIALGDCGPQVQAQSELVRSVSRVLLRDGDDDDNDSNGGQTTRPAVAPTNGHRQAVLPGPEQQTEDATFSTTLTNVQCPFELLRPVQIGTQFCGRILRHKSGLYARHSRFELFREASDGRDMALLFSAQTKQQNHVFCCSISTAGFDSDGFDGQIVAMVRANFTGTEFRICEAGPDPKMARELAAVIYTPNILGLKGPRKMTLIMPAPAHDALPPPPPKASGLLLQKYRSKQTDDLLVLHNKPPQWHPDSASHVLDFDGRVARASVKNFQIAPDADLDYIAMQFGRRNADTFALDCKYPFSVLVAFAVAMTSFAPKLSFE